MQGKVCRAFGGAPVNASLGADEYGRCKGVIGPMQDATHFMVPVNTPGSIGNIRHWSMDKSYCDRVGGAYPAGHGPWSTCDMGVKPLSAY